MIGDAPAAAEAAVVAAIVSGAVAETEIGTGSADDPGTETVTGTPIDQAPATSTATVNGRDQGKAAAIGIEIGIGTVIGIEIEAGIIGPGATVVRNRAATTGTATATETEIETGILGETAEAAAAIPDGVAAHARREGFGDHHKAVYSCRRCQPGRLLEKEDVFRAVHSTMKTVTSLRICA